MFFAVAKKTPFSVNGAAQTPPLGHRRRRSPAHCSGHLAAITVATLTGLACAQDVTTWHYDNARTGVQSAETTLTPANVATSTFGKLFSLPVLGDVYAQPLFLKQYKMNDGQLHNVVLVATERDYVYAFDADGKNPAQGYLWRQSLLGTGETFLSNNDVGTTDIMPDIGITGTPVVDRAGGTLYVVSKSKTTAATPAFFQRLHALNLADGAEKLSGPTAIQASTPGTGDSGSTVTFSPLLNNQRPALLLTPTPSVGSGSSVFISWSSHGDIGHYHGWVIAYDAANISRQNGAWTDTPNGSQGGIWMSGGGPSSDGLGNVFAADGNGTFDANASGKDFGDSAFKLSSGASGLTETDFFTPADQNSLNSVDNDMGTSAVALLPQQTGTIPNLAVTVDKSGTIYLLNRDNLGGYNASADSSLQSFSDGGFSIHNSVAFFGNELYLGADGGPLQGWTLNPQTERFTTTVQSRTINTFGCAACNGAGSTPSISANGSANGIVWALDNIGYGNSAAILHAYDPAHLGTEYYNSTQAANGRDTGAVAVKFTTPTIANGEVFVGGRNAVSVYGLIGSISTAAAPTFSPAGGTYTATQNITLADSTPGAAIYYTTNGTTPTSSATLYTGPIQVAVSETVQAIAVASGFAQSPQASATYIFSSAGSGSGAQTEVALTSAFNSIGIYTDGTTFSATGGANGGGDAYSANLLGANLTFGGVTYAFGPANQNNVVRGNGAPVVSLTQGNYSTVNFLATGVNGNRTAQVFTVTYTDGSTANFTQSLSSWLGPQKYPGEAIALTGAYRDTAAGGRDTRATSVYQYSFTLDSSKTVKSLTLPNNANVLVLAITLAKAQAQVPLTSEANAAGIYTDGATFSATGGIDNVGSAYSAALLGTSLTHSGVAYNFGPANTNDVVKGAGAPIVALTPGKYTKLNFLAIGLNGSQPSQVFTVTYSDGTTTQFTQSLSDWFVPQSYAGEATALVTPYRNSSNGTKDARTFNLYQYTFALDSTKTVRSMTLPNNANLAVLAVTLD